VNGKGKFERGLIKGSDFERGLKMGQFERGLCPFQKPLPPLLQRRGG
jgi:hypothetical protein